jgi:hypothetical protein
VRKTFGFIIGITLCTAIAILAYVYWPQRLPAADASSTELVQFCTTQTFENLPEDQKYVYVESLMNRGIPAIIAAANEAKLTDEQRQRGLENALQAGTEYRWGKHLDAWMQLDTRGKQEYAKKIAAQMPLRPPGINTPGPADRARGGGAGGSRGGRFSNPTRMKSFIESMPPERRAAMAEFMAELHEARGEK